MSVARDRTNRKRLHGRWVDLGGGAELVQRVQQHALRAADRADGDQTAISNPVVNGSPRDVEQLRRLVDRDAAPQPMLDVP